MTRITQNDGYTGSVAFGGGRRPECPSVGIRPERETGILPDPDTPGTTVAEREDHTVRGRPMMNAKQTRSFDLEIRLAGDGRTIAGKAVPYGERATIRDAYGSFAEMFMPGSFARSIVERGSKVRLLATHNARSFPLGKPTKLWEQPDGLYLEGRISDTRDGNEALTLIQDGVVRGFSVGFAPVRDSVANDGTRQIHEAALQEISLCAHPAYDGAEIVSVRSLSDALADLTEITSSPVLPGRPVALVERALHLLDMETRS